MVIRKTSQIIEKNVAFIMLRFLYSDMNHKVKIAVPKHR